MSSSRVTAGLDYPGSGALSEKRRPASVVGASASSDFSPSSSSSGLLGTASFTVGLLTAVAAYVPQLDPARQKQEGEHLRIRRRTGYTVLSILRGEQARILVPSQAISPWMKHAIVAAEDKRFYEHRGIDLRGMARALYADVSNRGTVQGGSTITQQFVKNAYLTSRKSVGRKLFEAALAWQLEQKVGAATGS